MPLPLSKDAPIVICGAGCFGLSTAYALLEQGYTHITLLERAATHPAPDAASTDINKIVRSAYADPVYCELAREAMTLWKNTGIWGHSYKESGVLVLAKDVAFGKENTIFAIEKASGAAVRELPTGADLASALPVSTLPGEFQGRSGYYNPEGGWADASSAISRLAAVVSERGAKLLLGQEVTGLAYGAFGGVSGVRVRGRAESVEGQLVVVACGAWTVPTFADPDLKLNDRMIATGQPITTIQLSPEETERYKDAPVILDFDTGFYCFPPTPDGVLKAARHCIGVVNPGSVSEYDLDETPLPVGSLPGYRRPDKQARPNAPSHSAIPRVEAELIRRVLREVYPELGDRPFSSSRMCWYSDTVDDDWIIDFHSQYDNVLLVTGDSGHGFKFLPNIGRLAVARLEGTLETALAAKFALALDRNEKRIAGSSFAKAPRQTLSSSDLVFAEDMDPAAQLGSLQDDSSWTASVRSE
ncbi:FAD dependent oxidoreductase [Auriculariales sp. MPI-PUGE-AT-0066]|nr:FAD dependent oxidoreductase [Auriculariales sp. MPI-PUGE-AT-0066]